MRILHVMSSLKKNGTETFVMNVFRHIDKTTFKFDFLVFNDAKDGFYDEIIGMGANIFFLPPRNKGFIAYHHNLNHFFKQNAGKYDAVHLHDMSLSSVAPLYFAKKHGISKRVIHIHGANTGGIHNKIFHRLNRLRLSHIATHALSCSMNASKWGYATTSLYKDSMVIPNGINLDRFVFNSDARYNFRKDFSIQDDEKVLIHVGNFNNIKNQKFLLDLVNYFNHRDNKVKLLCVGTGFTLNPLKEYAQKLEIDNKVFFLGYRDDIPSLMSAADILVFPSIHEGLGLVVVEAMATGLPAVVSTGVPAEVGVVKDKFYRFDLSSGVEFWANEISKIPIDPIQRSQPKAIEKYSIKNTVNLLTDIYKS